MPVAGEERKKASILIVDDESSIATVVSRQLTRDGYDCADASNGVEAVKILEARGYDFDVVVTDLKMPEMSGMELLKVVKEHDPEIQVIVMTGNPDVDIAVEAIRSEVDDYLVKPFELNQMGHSVARALEHRQLLREIRLYRTNLEERVQAQAQRIERLFLDGISALAAAIEARDRYTGGHLDRVSTYALATGYQMALEANRIWNLWLGSLFHDVGKLAIPDAILNKPGPLTDDEYEQMKKHPELGVQIVQQVSFLKATAPGILHHQERWDGKGYPAGLAGEAICVEGRILAVSDAFDAMITDRPYRQARPEEEAAAELVRCSGSQFDPTVVGAFLQAREEGFPYKLPETHHPELGN